VAFPRSLSLSFALHIKGHPFVPVPPHGSLKVFKFCSQGEMQGSILPKLTLHLCPHQ
jgi:hypothetical protein